MLTKQLPVRIDFELPGAIPQVPVLHLETALDYYMYQLGFQLMWKTEKESAGIAHGKMSLLLNRQEDYQLTPIVVWLKLETRDQVNRLYEQWSSDGAIILFEPETKPWGLHEFIASDPDGNKIRVYSSDQQA